MNLRNTLLIDTNQIHYIVFIIISIVLVTWQYFGMSRTLVIMPEDDIQSLVSPHSDPINGGLSETSLTTEDGRLKLECNIKVSVTFAFCGVTIPLIEAGKAPLNMNRYSEMHLEFDYRSPDDDSLLVYLINHETLSNGHELDKANLSAVIPNRGTNKVTLELNRFFVPSWWIFFFNEEGLNTAPDISQVKAIQITTGDNPTARDVEIIFSRIKFSGKWLSAEELYLGLLVSWFLLLLIHGLLHVRTLSKNYRHAAGQNKTLTNLNHFLSIQKDQYESMAKEDELTGVWNRAGIRPVLEQVIYDYKEHSKPCSLMIIDIDNFKEVNDIFGHAVGDQALVALASLVESLTRENDYFARWGGEEFVLICTNSSAQGALCLAENLRASIEQASLVSERRITCSFGVAKLSNGNVEGWFEQADEALYQAKRSGRNCVRLYQSEKNAKIRTLNAL